MPKKVDILNTKFFNQLKNGSSFDTNLSEYTPNFVGNTRERIKFECDIELQWFANSSFTDIWNIANGRIERSFGSFLDDGFFILGQFEFYPTWTSRQSASPEFTAQVDFISNDGLTLEFTVLSGSQTTTELENTTSGIWADPIITANEINSFIYSFGLLEDNESFNIQSKVSLNEQQYSIRQINVGVNTLEPKGNFKDWQTGNATLERITPTAKNTDKFTITHEFDIVPYYLEGQLTNLQDNKATDLYLNSNTLNYNFETEFRHTSVDVQTALISNPKEIKGNIGWFNENFNGFSSDYEVTAVNYLVGSEIDINTSNTVTITINKLSGAINTGDNIVLYFSYLPNSETEYQDTTTTLSENFIQDSIVCTVGSGSVAGSGVFDSCEAVLSGGNAVITATLSFSSEQINKLSISGNYLLSAQIEDNTLSASNSDRVHLIADVSGATYDNSATNAGLITWNRFNLLTHTENLGVDSGSSSIEQWNEDGFLLDFEFDLDTNKEALLNNLSFKLVADNGTNNFELDLLDVNVQNSVISNGIQQINIDSTRNYILNTSDQFNNVDISLVSNIAGIAKYEGSFGQKIKWQDWLQNLEVDPIFYDNSQPNENLNFKSSNYSNLNSYNIKLLVTSNISGLDVNSNNITQNVDNFSGNIRVYDYDISDDGEVVTGALQLLDSDTLTDLQGQILSNKDTLLRVTWDTSSNLDASDIRYIAHRIQPLNSSGDDIEESSSLRGAVLGGILKDTTFSKVGDDIVSESLIDYTKLDPQKCYNVSARIQALSPVSIGFADGVCEVTETTSLPPLEVSPDPEPDPPIKVPAFCGDALSAGGGAGIFDFAFEVEYNGYIAFGLEPFAIPDKAEWFKQPRDANKNILYSALPPTILATTHLNNVDPTLDVAINSGLGQSGGNLNNELFEYNAGLKYLRRSLSEAAQGAGVLQNGSDSDVQYIGSVKGLPYPATDRFTEYTNVTGSSNIPTIGFDGDSVQLVWMPVSVGDLAVLRVSGQGGTQWFGNVFCHQI